MEKQERRMGMERYEAALQTSGFLASEGHYELALEVTRRALEKLNLEKETEPFSTPEDNESRRAVEATLTQKYLAFRAKIEGENRPYRKTILQTIIVSGIISFFIIVTTSIVVVQFQSLIKKPMEIFMNSLQETVRSELPKLTSDVRDQIPIVSKKVQDEIPKMASDLTKMVDEKLSKTIESKVETIVNEKLPQVVETRLKRMSEDKNR